ncbi:MAG TPA: hypothetical protein VHD90_07585 [Phototrophicaceae bacterium]|nr:hypothetical protein [Phototrophicaceae bacterium]
MSKAVDPRQPGQTIDAQETFKHQLDAIKELQVTGWRDFDGLVCGFLEVIELYADFAAHLDMLIEKVPSREYIAGLETIRTLVEQLCSVGLVLLSDATPLATGQSSDALAKLRTTLDGLKNLAFLPPDPSNTLQ